MKYNIKRDNKKPLVVALGVLIALAPGAVIIDNLEPVSVYAVNPDGTNPEDMEYGYFFPILDQKLTQLREDIDDHIRNNDLPPATLAEIADTASIINTFYQNMKWAIDEDVELFLNPTVYYGFYKTSSDSPLYSGTITAPRSFDYATISTSSHWSIQIEWQPYSANVTGTPNCTSYLDGNGFRYSCRTSSGEAYRFNWSDKNGYLSGVGGSTVLANQNKILFTALTSTTPPVVSGSISGSSKTLLGSGAVPELPDSVEMDKANPPASYDNLINYLKAKHPNLPDFMFPSTPQPSDNYEPIYPTGETVSGMPKEWTIKNPQLPTSPQIGFNAYNVDTSDYDVSSTLSEYTDGFGFWWWLTGKCLDVTHTKGIVIATIILGLVGFILWRLGGSL